MMKKQILIIVHVEPLFVKCCSGLGRRIKEWVQDETNNIHEVINVVSGPQFEDRNPVLPEFRSFIRKEWYWGYFPTDSCVEGKQFIPVSTHHGFAEISDWMHSLAKEECEYTLVGGSESECLQDVYEIFQFLGLKCRKGPYSLIY